MCLFVDFFLGMHGYLFRWDSYVATRFKLLAVCQRECTWDPLYGMPRTRDVLQSCVDGVIGCVLKNGKWKKYIRDAFCIKKKWDTLFCQLNLLFSWMSTCGGVWRGPYLALSSKLGPGWSLLSSNVIFSFSKCMCLGFLVQNCFFYELIPVAFFRGSSS